jgi:small basic protein
MLEAKYSYVPKGRVRLGFTGEVFWPVYTSGADFGALIFAFGAGAGVNMQLAITSQLGVDVFGKLRYLRRPIEGQSGVQERQTLLGAGLVFSF